MLAAADPAAMASPPEHRPLPVIPGAAGLSLSVVTPGSVPPEETDALVARLGALGIGDTRVTPVRFKVSETHIRYYHREDAAAAEVLASFLGTEARDHTTFRPRPPDGTVEVFVAGERGAAQPARAATASSRATAPARATTPARTTAEPPRQARPAPQAQPQDDGTSAIRERIINRMRRGEHL
jgi:hypothetical protein